jgi:hypothetical protein
MEKIGGRTGITGDQDSRVPKVIRTSREDKDTEEEEAIRITREDRGRIGMTGISNKDTGMEVRKDINRKD